MSSRTKGPAGTGPSGLLIVDKPLGVTSHDVVAAVRAVLGIRRVGHAGTLDPLATGALIVGFGHATRLLNAIVDHMKTYEATICLGVGTVTDDAEGAFIAEPARVDCGAITEQMVADTIRQRFLGEISQIPSSYSAIKVDGRRAYDLARQGRAVELEARSITISRYDLLAMRPSEVTVDGAPRTCVDLDVIVSCSAGTYIRALARDLGEILGTGGYLTRLRRTTVGAFDVDTDRAVRPEVREHRFTDRGGVEHTRNKAVLDMDAPTLLAHALPMAEAARRTMDTVAIDEDQARELRYGRRIDMAIDGECAAIVTGSDEVVALLRPAPDGQAKPAVVFPAEERTARVDAADTR